MASDDAIDVNIGFKQFVIAVDSYAANESFVTMDGISIMFRNLCCHLLDLNKDFFHICYVLMVVNIYKYG